MSEIRQAEEPPPDLRKHPPPLFCREYLQNLRHSQGRGYLQPDSQTFAKSRTCAGLRTCAGVFRVADICSDFCCFGHLQPVQRLFPAAPDCAAFASTRATISTKTPAVLHRRPGQVPKYKNTSSLTVLHNPYGQRNNAAHTTCKDNNTKITIPRMFSKFE